MGRRWIEGMAVVMLAGTSGCGACGTPAEIEVLGSPGSGVTITWEESNAMGLYFVEPDAVLPGGPDDVVVGHPYWVLEATSFPGGFEAPVEYRTMPDDTKDATAEHGGVAGGEPLECGVPYKVAVVALGGHAELAVEWPCP